MPWVFPCLYLVGMDAKHVYPQGEKATVSGLVEAPRRKWLLKVLFWLVLILVILGAAAYFFRAQLSFLYA